MCNAVQAFFHSGDLLKVLNQTFITLIPKIPNFEEVSHFRPISLCNVFYKIILKVLANKLKPIMDSIITPYQNAFIKGRNISDNILLVREIIDVIRKKRERRDSFRVLKIDMSKAYDRVNWNFLKAVLIVMNFDSKWIMECVSSIEYTLLINGSMTRSFKPSQGLRQGDPLSPYLFLMCANMLSISLTQAENLKKIRVVKVGRNGLSFSNLLFANDSLFFLRNDNTSVQNLQHILKWYCFISSQSINLAKSDVFCSPTMLVKEQIGLARTLQVSLVQ